MRWVIFACLLLSVFISYAQNDTTKYVGISGYGYKYDRIKVKSAVLLPTDTVLNKIKGSIAILNDTFYFRGNSKWKTAGSAGIDTASLSNRINLKLNISDTSNKWVTSVYRKTGSDSVFYVKGGSATFAFKDSIGITGGSGTVTSVATNTATGITGGTITTTGTLAIDTTLISTRAWRQKGIDSVQANVNLKLNISDTSTMLSPYLRKADTASLSNRINLKLNASDTASLSNRINLKLNISDTAAMLANYQRTSAFPMFVFGGGSGAAGDTASFSTSALYGSFYNTGGDTIVVTSMIIGLQGTSASVTANVYYNDSLGVTAGATKLVNTPSASTNTTTGTTVTPDNTKIPPGNFVWCSTPTVTTKPTFFTLTLIGYRKR